MDGHWFTIPALPAADWLAIFMAPEFNVMSLGQLVDEPEEFMERFMGADDDLERLLLEIISTVTARKWWIAVRLLGIALKAWSVLGGEMITRVDATRVSIAAWLDAFTVVMVDRLKPDSGTMTILQIELPPEGEESDPFEMDEAQFLSLGND